MPADTFIDIGSTNDPNEISFSRGEVLDILDMQGKWWQAKKSDGTVGSEHPFLPKRGISLNPISTAVPSNYLQLL